MCGFGGGRGLSFKNMKQHVHSAWKGEESLHHQHPLPPAQPVLRLCCPHVAWEDLTPKAPDDLGELPLLLSPVHGLDVSPTHEHQSSTAESARKGVATPVCPGC